MRELTAIEKDRLAILTGMSIGVGLLEPTVTGLQKSIMDATANVRNYLLEHGLHDYLAQKQGQENKVILKATILNKDLLIPSSASLYRPNTKKGDPRIWFKGLANMVKPHDVLALISSNDEIFVINLTREDLEEISLNKSGPLWDVLLEISLKETEVSSELLGKLKEIASRGFIPSVMEKEADTAIGRTLETLLEIQINSSKTPDYKGIELKSYRLKKGAQNRKNLFAQVPNWQLSKFKSMDEVLGAFGYLRNGVFRLNCTVSSKVRNSQGLSLRLEQEKGLLHENSNRQEVGDFITWAFSDLRKRLLEKHAETFWIEAETKKAENKEWFHFTKVHHTKKPIASQFDILLDQGMITLDHLIKRKPNGSAHEKGPLFKIKPNSLNLLFPPSKVYNLQET